MVAAAVPTSTPITPARRLEFQSRIIEMDPTIGRDSPRFRAAMLLLALTIHPPQIDHLSRALGIPREFLARCMRRLVDNGILEGNGLVGGWSTSSMVPAAFWADVNVATGQWLRRHDSRGSLEWTEAGSWQKPYDYTPTEAVESSTRYIVSEGLRPQLLVDCLADKPTFRAGGWIGMPSAVVFGSPESSHDMDIIGLPGGREFGKVRDSVFGMDAMPGTSTEMSVWLS